MIHQKTGSGFEKGDAIKGIMANSWSLKMAILVKKVWI
jgi:hypothetical protein